MLNKGITFEGSKEDVLVMLRKSYFKDIEEDFNFEYAFIDELYENTNTVKEMGFTKATNEFSLISAAIYYVQREIKEDVRVSFG